MTITVDDLVDNKHEHVGTRVNVKGILDYYSMSTGLLAERSIFKLEGERWKISVVSRRAISTESVRSMKPYFDAHMGKEVIFDIGVQENYNLYGVEFSNCRFVLH